MLLRSRIALTAPIVLALAGIVGADQKKRWELDFSHERPEHYTYTSPLGKASTYWYFVYTVTNNTPQAVPLIVDVELRVDQKVYQHPGFYPVEEAQIIAHADKLEGYSLGIQKEIIEDHKKKRRFLNRADLRQIPVLQSGEKVHCIMMYEDQRHRYNDVEVLVSGLVDPVSYQVSREEGASYAKGPVHLKYENRVYRLTYHRHGDEFKSFARGLHLVRHDWIVVGINPAITKTDISELVAALNHDDQIVRKVALDLLRRYTIAGRPDVDLRGLDQNGKAAKFLEMKAAIQALGGVTDVNKLAPGMFPALEAELVARIPPIPDELTNLKRGNELNSDEIKALSDALKVVITKAMENKCPTPGTSIGVMTRAEPTSEYIYDWVCGYTDPSTGILYHGVQQWKEFLTDLMSNKQQGNFQFVEALFESIKEDADPAMKAISLQILKDICTDERMVFDVSTFDPAKKFDEQAPAVKDAIWRWREWWSRNRDTSYWDASTQSFEPLKPKR
jgi:hypothetical protein